MCNEILCAHAMVPTSYVIQRLLPSVVAGGIFNIVSPCGDKQNLCNLVSLWWWWWWLLCLLVTSSCEAIVFLALKRTNNFEFSVCVFVCVCGSNIPLFGLESWNELIFLWKQFTFEAWNNQMFAVQNCCLFFRYFFLLLRTDLSSSLRSRTNMLANIRMAASGMPYIKFTPYHALSRQMHMLSVVFFFVVP